ncbi:MAG: TetR/AcrR family transcriptional regulator [Pseudomonadota bacterium]
MTKGRKQRGRRALSGEARARFRVKIATTAQALFFAAGYDAVSMRKVAAALNVSPMTLYLYFKNKRAILIHIWSAIFTEAFAACQAAAQVAATPQAKLFAYCHAYVGYWLRHPQHYALIYLNQDLPQAGEAFFITDAGIVRELAFLRALLRRAGVAEDKAEPVLQQIIIALNGVCHAALTIPEYPWDPPLAQAEHMVRALLQAASYEAENPAPRSAEQGPRRKES